MGSPAVMAVLGHSGSQAPQLMHTATIFIAMRLFLPRGSGHPAKLASPIQPRVWIARFLPDWAEGAFEGSLGPPDVILAGAAASPRTGPPRQPVHALYSVVLALGFVIGMPWFLWKGRSSGEDLRAFRERMGRLPVYLNLDGDRSIWIHAVSVGEVLAARPLVPALRERFPSHRIFLSTTTLTGNEAAKKSVRGLDGLFFAPFDFPHAVRHALEVVNPSLLVLVETELWPNLIHEASRRGARVALVNGRISLRSFPRYKRMGRFLSRVLSEIDLFLMQGEPHAERIRAMTAPPERVMVTGNLKFDAVFAGRPPERLVRLLHGGSPRPLWVAGSTGGGEEGLGVRAFPR